MNGNEVYLRQLSKILGDYLGKNDLVLSADTRILSEYDLSSYDLVELVVIAEDTFHIRIPDQSIRSITTAGMFCELIEELSK